MSSLVVDTNIAAMDTISSLGSTNSAMNQVIGELSTGLKVQSAATGPASYAIGQTLEAQANGYAQAITNAQDGASLLQTAQGAMTQIMSVLQTMDQLALTSSNAAGSTTTALQSNQAEFTALVKTITQIASSTTFGSTKLLTGGFSGTLQVGAFNTASDQVALSITGVTPKGLGLKGTAGIATAGAALATGKVTLAAAKTLKIKVTTGSNSATYTVKFTPGTYTLSQIESKINAVAGKYVYASSGTGATATKLVIQTVSTGTTAKVTVTKLATFGYTTTPSTTGTGSSIGAASIATTATATKAITTVQAAINKLSTIAANVGAKQDELSAIAANLTVGQQNLAAAQSQFVDATMASAMTTFTTDSILMQTGVAMLAQAQQTPSLVLKLIG